MDPTRLRGLGVLLRVRLVAGGLDVPALNPEAALDRDGQAEGRPGKIEPPEGRVEPILALRCRRPQARICEARISSRR
jgi:hypothetical protein